MPIITVDGPKVTKKQKKELVNSLTKTASQILDFPEESIIVLLKETDPDNVGVGGKLISEREDNKN
ncbi:2-hydroxymuconate tautomerase family protein [Natroniella sulfidigena]|uniref:4-oxalocrotonate tautomerase DmpI n=1 Tax=Natroniella sulfidigena TaxID=723921 RepID=UPI00200B0F20|nr:4-oxalocrotonate tautomerase DmpI [Natroniella sulfidigena]MCK8817949.1 2-hydroxymuconate tautomerase family protein [Natroniella sulfidigena]